MAQNNDIVITAQANTKEAEASIKRLDNQIKSLTASDPKLQKLGLNLSAIGGKVQNATQAMNLGFSTLQGSFNGVITKLGAVGLAIGALKVAWDTAEKENQRYWESFKQAAEASGKYISTVKDQTNGLISNLEKLDKLADDGYLSDESLQQTNNLVSQLNNLWGDVGVSVDQATGKVNGLQAATKKINEELKAMQLQKLKLEEDVALNNLAAAEQRHDWWFDENGHLQNEAQGLMIAGTWTMEGYGAFRRELENNVKTAKAELLGIQAQIQAINGNTTQNDINDTVAAATAYKAEHDKGVANWQKLQQQKQDVAQRLQAEQARLKPFDAEEARLRQALVDAQALGQDVEVAREALKAYLHEKDFVRMQMLQSDIALDTSKQRSAQENYEWLLTHGASQEELLQAIQELNAANEQLAKDMEELSQIGARLEQPEEPIEEPETEVAAITKSIANGTFSAYGIDSLRQVNIEQEQLRVQKEIAANTKQLAKPVVGE